MQIPVIDNPDKQLDFITSPSKIRKIKTPIFLIGNKSLFYFKKSKSAEKKHLYVLYLMGLIQKNGIFDTENELLLSGVKKSEIENFFQERPGYLYKTDCFDPVKFNFIRTYYDFNTLKKEKRTKNKKEKEKLLKETIANHGFI